MVTAWNQNEPRHIEISRFDSNKSFVWSWDIENESCAGLYLEKRFQAIRIETEKRLYTNWYSALESESDWKIVKSHNGLKVKAFYKI